MSRDTSLGLYAADKPNRKSARSGRTFASFVSEVWLPWVQENLNSWKLSKRIVDARILPFFGSMNICDIDFQLILEWQADLERQGFAQTTRVRFLYALKSVFDLAVKVKMIISSPCPKAERERPERKAERILSLEKTKEIYDALKMSDNKEAMAILLMLYVNVPKNTILKAKWEDIYLEEGLLLHKSANGKRSRILLNNDAVEIIRKLPIDSHWLFSSEDKTKPLNDTFYFWNGFRKSVNIPDLLLCEIRQSYNYWRFRLGNGDLKEPVRNISYTNTEKINEQNNSSALL